MNKWDIKERIRDRRGHSLRIDGNDFDKWDNMEFIREAQKAGTNLSIDLGSSFDKWDIMEIIRQAKKVGADLSIDLGSSFDKWVLMEIIREAERYVSLSASMGDFDKWIVKEVERVADDNDCEFSFY